MGFDLNLTPRTIIEYQRVVSQFIKRCPPDLQSLQDVTFEHLRTYISGLQQQGLAPKTVWDRVVILKRFFGFLVDEGCLARDPAALLPFPRVGSRLPRALSVQETAALLSAPRRVLRSLLGHCHMGTTGRHLQLTDQMAKQIAKFEQNMTRGQGEWERRSRCRRRSSQGMVRR